MCFVKNFRGHPSFCQGSPKSSLTLYIKCFGQVNKHGILLESDIISMSVVPHPSPKATQLLQRVVFDNGRNLLTGLSPAIKCRVVWEVWFLPFDFVDDCNCLWSYVEVCSDPSFRQEISHWCLQFFLLFNHSVLISSWVGGLSIFILTGLYSSWL